MFALYLDMKALLRFTPILTAILQVISCRFAFAISSPYPGYVSDVQVERSERFVEVYLYSPSKSTEPTLQEQIFNPLSQEFKSKYREQFGQLDTESFSYQSAFTQLDENRGALPIVQAKSEKRKAFAEYMTKRLIEHHVDQYMKSKPEMRPVMEVKERIQNVKVEVTKTTRLNIQYNFAGNMVDFILDNPYCDSKMSLEMDPRAFGPSQVLETKFWVGKGLTKTVRVNSYAAVTDGVLYGDISKAFPKYNISQVFGIRGAIKPEGTSPRETQYLVGFSHSY